MSVSLEDNGVLEEKSVFPFFLYSFYPRWADYTAIHWLAKERNQERSSKLRTMEFYDVGSSDLRELWESYLSEPVSIFCIIILFSTSKTTLYIHILHQNSLVFLFVTIRNHFLRTNEFFSFSKNVSPPLSPYFLYRSSRYDRYIAYTKSIRLKSRIVSRECFILTWLTRKCSFLIGERTKGNNEEEGRGREGIGKTRVSRFYFLLPANIPHCPSLLTCN